jgi:hypothetical protein
VGAACGAGGVVVWVKLDDGFHSHPTTWAVGLEANGLYCRCLSYAGFHLTDGFVPSQWIYAQVPATSRGRGTVARLVDQGLLEEIQSGFQIVGFLEFNSSKEEVQTERAWARARGALSRDRDLVAAIRDRDGDHCRYCARKVNWSDRRGPRGGTYDHVEPRGENSLENIVVACKSCNSRKGNRTLNEVGMKLRPAPTQVEPSSNLDSTQVLPKEPVLDLDQKTDTSSPSSVARDAAA